MGRINLEVKVGPLVNLGTAVQHKQGSSKGCCRPWIHVRQSRGYVYGINSDFFCLHLPRSNRECDLRRDNWGGVIV